MARTVTIDAGEWKYPDSNGVTHTVTAGQTFVITNTDVSGVGTYYRFNVGTGVTTTDGRKLVFRNESAETNGIRVLYPTDAGEGTANRRVRGEWAIVCPETGKVQYWKPVTFNVDNATTPTTITAIFEDQFGHTFTWTAVTVGA